MQQGTDPLHCPEKRGKFMNIILGSMTFADQVNQHDALAMINAFKSAGFNEIDTAYVYVNGKTENLLGELQQKSQLDNCRLATKVNPRDTGLGKASIDNQFTTSLKRLGVDAVDLLYLHQPDPDTPIEDSLAAINEHHKAGRFKRFGLSNYAAWQVADIYRICEREGYPLPTVYQGMYNALTRDVERELLLCLKEFDIAFYVYNPLAGGVLSGKHNSHSTLPDEGRFSTNRDYQKRYWKEDYFKAIDTFVEVCNDENIPPYAAALRWLIHHSALDNRKSDAVILGASKIEHFQCNLAAVTEGKLPQNIVDALDKGWEICRSDCIKYFRP